MNNEWDSFIDELVSNPEPIAIKRAANEKRFPCAQCAGTGIYSGLRVHQEKRHCFACRGKGYFKTDPRKLQKAREARASKKEDALAKARAANESISLFSQVQAIASWHSFAQSLMEQHYSGRAWSERQVAAMADALDRIQVRAKEREAAALQVNLQAILDLFSSSTASGYRRPTYRAEGLILSLAPEGGANAGAIYVKSEDKSYLGKVVAGRYLGVDQAREALSVIAASPRDAAIRYGQRTGTCACCGRTLSNAASIKLGIGPICAERWGLL
jgi:hypothetical protein